jgi:hypothetical protein
LGYRGWQAGISVRARKETTSLPRGRKFAQTQTLNAMFDVNS